MTHRRNTPGNRIKNHFQRRKLHRDFFVFLLYFVVFLSLSAPPARATVFLSVEEALKLAFPESTIKRGTVYLTRTQLAQAQALAGVEIRSALVHPYVAVREHEVVGIAYFDTHVVRTLPETMMIVVDREDRVRRIEVLSFNEPREYIPRPAWYHQFLGRRLDETLILKRKIRGVVGATLTARAATEAVRRVLALHHVLKERISP